MIHAVVLIEADRSVLSSLGGELTGVHRTQTMVAFEVYSRHDLEALFSVGQ
jgi:hypothetical protein